MKKCSDLDIISDVIESYVALRESGPDLLRNRPQEEHVSDITDSIKHFKGDDGRHRFVKFDANGNAISAIEVKRNSWDKKVKIANLYTADEHRRKGHATELFRIAKERFPRLSHSSDLTKDGKAWKSSLRRHLKESEYDYRSAHGAPAPDDDVSSPLHNVTLNKTYPEDFYSHKGFRIYSDYGEPHDFESHQKVVRNRDKPDEKINIWRAIPTSVYKDAFKKAKQSGQAPIRHMIQKGDWVTISRKYAIDHGKNALNGDYKVVMLRVPAKHVYTNGDSIHEWGYHPDD